MYDCQSNGCRQVALVSRYLTRWFIIFVVLSWVLVFPFQLLFPLVQQQVRLPSPLAVLFWES